MHIYNGLNNRESIQSTYTLDLPGIGYLLVFRQTVYKLYQAYNISFLSIGARADHALIGLIAQVFK